MHDALEGCPVLLPRTLRVGFSSGEGPRVKALVRQGYFDRLEALEVEASADVRLIERVLRASPRLRHLELGLVEGVESLGACPKLETVRWSVPQGDLKAAVGSPLLRAGVVLEVVGLAPAQLDALGELLPSLRGLGLSWQHGAHGRLFRCLDAHGRDLQTLALSCDLTRPESAALWSGTWGQLRRLSLSSTHNVGAACLGALEAPNLESLCLERVTLSQGWRSAQGLDHLRKLMATGQDDWEPLRSVLVQWGRQLVALSLGFRQGVQALDEAVLEACPGLSHLVLGQVELGDEVCGVLGACQGLRRLGLQHCRVSEASFWEALEGLDALESLSLRHSWVGECAPLELSPRLVSLEVVAGGMDGVWLAELLEAASRGMLEHLRLVKCDLGDIESLARLFSGLKRLEILKPTSLYGDALRGLEEVIEGLVVADYDTAPEGFSQSMANWIKTVSWPCLERLHVPRWLEFEALAQALCNGQMPRLNDVRCTRADIGSVERYLKSDASPLLGCLQPGPGLSKRWFVSIVQPRWPGTNVEL